LRPGGFFAAGRDRAAGWSGGPPRSLRMPRRQSAGSVNARRRRIRQRWTRWFADTKLIRHGADRAVKTLLSQQPLERQLHRGRDKLITGPVFEVRVSNKQ
jgi:hypothetical protein